jgi:L-lactate dehydrogenase complex protein LldG
MTETATDEFAAAVRETGASVTHTSASAAGEEIATLVDAPAVGTPLPFDDVSYEGTIVEPEPTGVDLADAETSVTAGTLGIADYGSVVLEETGAGEELLSLYAETHVVVVAASDVVPDMPAAFDALDGRFEAAKTDAIIATGPSATADMGAVVTGVHGPGEVHVVVLEDR